RGGHLVRFDRLLDPVAVQSDTLSLHDALPILLAYICQKLKHSHLGQGEERAPGGVEVDGKLISTIQIHQGQLLVVCLELAHQARSEEHTSELQSRFDLVCRLLLEKKKQNNTIQ